MGITINRIHKDNIHKLFDLFNSVYNKSLSLDYFQKKYNTIYTGIEHLGYMALDNGKPVSFFGAIPYRAIYNDKEFIIPQSCDVMTHSEYRNKGLLAELAKMTMKLMVNHGIEYSFGFPNQNSFSFSKNILKGYLEKYIHRYTFSVNTFPLERLCGKSKQAYKVYKKLINNNLTSIKSTKEYIPSIFENSDSAYIIHDEKFIRYKSFTDNFIIELYGTSVWIKVNNGIHIGSFGTKSIDRIKIILLSLKKIAQKLGIKSIHYYCSEGTSIDLIMSSIQKPEKAWSTCIIPLINKKSIPYDKFCFTYADFDTF